MTARILPVPQGLGGGSLRNAEVVEGTSVPSANPARPRTNRNGRQVALPPVVSSNVV